MTKAQTAIDRDLENPTRSLTPAGHAKPRGCGRILLVDDEPLIRELVAEYLQE
jgi:hypothetical protein